MKPLLYPLTFLLMLSIASALTVQELVESYDYNYINGSINITTYTNGMLDTNNNGVNDTLIFNFTVVPFVTGDYNTIVILSNNNGVWTSNTNKSLTTTGIVQVNFSTLDLNGSIWNYTVRIFDINNVAVFEKYRQNTSTYNTYENGTTIKSISDASMNNNSINITLTFNVSRNETVNITGFLGYNTTDNVNTTKNGTISAKTEATLIVGEQNVSILFDNETIKTTHANGTFVLEAVTIGNKTIKQDYKTAAYNYEDFAKTSYFKAYNHSFSDNNGNGLYEFLKLNLTVNSKIAGTYTITGAIYDLFDHLVLNYSETFTLGTGIQVINLSLNGSQIYQSYTDGPYVIKYMSLKNSTGDVVDYVSESYTTNSTSINDYELPKLPDVQVVITASIDNMSAQTNLTVNISNKGSAPAVGILLDLLDNTSIIRKNESVESLAANEWQAFNYTITNMNSTNLSYVAIVDMFDSIDELNESNNVYIYPAAPTFENSTYIPTNPKFNDVISFNITIKDDINGSYYIFSYNNGSGFINDTPVLWNGTNQIRIEVNKTLTGKAGVLVQWLWYANDTENTMAESDMYSFTIVSIAPTIETPVFNVTNVTKASGIKANTTYRDADNDNGTVYFTWYRNGSVIFTENLTNITSATIVNSSLSSTFYNRTDLINVTVFGNDSVVNSSTNYSITVTVGNSVPVQTAVLNSTLGTNLTKENVTVYNISTADADNDPVKNIYNWFRNNTPIAVANLPFEGGSNTTFTKDYSTLENNGTVTGATYNSSGGYDGFGAYNFSGRSTNNITLKNSPSLNMTGDQLTLEAWIKPQGPAGFKQIIARASGTGSTQRQYGLYVHSAGTLGFEVRTSSGLGDNNFGTISNGTWYHVVGTYNGTMMIWYIDGVEVGNWSQTGNIQAQVSDVQIGQFPAGFSKFNGTIDEVRIYNVSLTAEQVLAHYRNRTDVIAGSTLGNRTLLRIGDSWNASVTPNDGIEDGATLTTTKLIIVNAIPTQGTPILNSTYGTNLTSENVTVYNISTADADGDAVKNIYNWFRNNTPIGVINLPFEGGSNATLTKDYSPFQNNGTVTGATYQSTGGFDSKGAYSFDGNDYIDLGGKQMYQLSQNVTLMAWVYKNNTGVGFAAGIPYDNGSVWDAPWVGIQIGASGPAGARFWINVNGTDREYSHTGALTLDRWHHIAQTYDGVIARGYVDGVQVATSAFPGTIQYSGLPNFTVGVRSLQAAGEYWVGKVDDVRLYNKTLSAEQIKAIYDNRSDIIVSNEIEGGDTWNASVTPNDGTEDGLTKWSNNLTIYINYVPTHATPILNATSGRNFTTDNLTVYNISTADGNGDNVTNIINWYKDNSPLFIAHLPFEGGTNTTFARDYSGRNYSGNGTGIVWENSSGFDGFGVINLTTDGSTVRYFNLSNTKGVNLNNDSFSIEAWFMVRKGTTFNNLVVKAVSTVAEQFRLGIRSSTGNVEFSMRNTTDFVQSVAAQDYADGKWHHVIAVRDKKEGRQYIYVDNILQDNDSNTLTNINPNTGDNIVVGQIGPYTAIVQQFNGSVGVVRIWNTSLSSEQAALLWQNKTEVIHTSLLGLNQTWNASITPNDKQIDGTTLFSNSLLIRQEPTVELIFGYGGETMTSTSYNVTETLVEQPVEKMTSTNYNVTLGWTLYG